MHDRGDITVRLRTAQRQLDGWAAGASGLLDTGRIEDDVSEAATEIERLREEVARTERNRDMWKGQCERQAAALTDLRSSRAELVDALAHYMFGVDQMNAAMKDGVNVHGAVAALTAAEELASAAIAKASTLSLNRMEAQMGVTT